MDQETTNCRVCGKVCEHLGSHIYHAHGFTAREYKAEYGLPYKMSLISPRVKEKKQEAYAKNREYYLKNLMINGEKYRFQEGHTNHGQKPSPYSLKQAIARINDVNAKRKPEACPVCKMVFDSLPSHLYNAHGLVQRVAEKKGFSRPIFQSNGEK